MKKIGNSKRILLLLCIGVLVVVAMESLFGCNSGSDVDIIIPPPEEPAVFGGESPLISTSSVETFEVVTDGAWVAWTASERGGIMYYNGTITKNLTASLAPETYDGMDFDGQYLIFWSYLSKSLYYCDVLASDPKPVLVADTLDGWEEFQVSGGIIAWTHGEIFYYNINASTPSVVQLTDNQMNKGGLEIDDGVIVWHGINYGEPPPSANFYYSDLKTDEPVVVQLVDNDPQGDVPFSIGWGIPSIDAGIITWQADRLIYYCDLNSDVPNEVQLIEGHTGYIEPPRIDAGVITWSEYNGIFYYDLNAINPEVLQITEMRSQYSPQISDGVITWTVWEEGYPPQVFYYDLNAQSPMVKEITEDLEKGFFVSSSMDSLQIDSGNITWQTGYRSLVSYNPKTDSHTNMELTDTSTYYNSPMVKNGRTVWIGEASYKRVYVQKVGSEEQPRILTPLEMSVGSLDLDLSDGLLVWSAWYGSSDSEIYYCDLNTETQEVKQLTESKINKDYPQIHDGVVVWLSGYSSDQKMYYSDLKDTIPEVVEFNHDDIFNAKPQIHSGVITWAHGGIFYYDINAAIPSEVQIPHQDNLTDDPKVDSGIITWEDPYYGGIYYYDLHMDTPELVKIAHDHEDVGPPHISDGVIAWSGLLDNDGTGIYYYDLNSSNPLVTQITDNLIRGGVIDVDKGVITWISEGEIFIYDLNATSPEIIQITDGEWHYYSKTKVSGNVIAWTNSGNTYAIQY